MGEGFLGIVMMKRTHIRGWLRFKYTKKVWILWKPEISKSRQTVVGVTEYCGSAPTHHNGDDDNDLIDHILMIEYAGQ